MSSIDRTFNRIDDNLSGIREELRGLHGDFSALQRTLVQIGFSLVGVLIAALVALILALGD